MKRCFARRLALLGIALFAILVLSPQLSAQQTLGSINGTVLDPTGAAIQGAKVTVTASDIGVTRITTTQGTGYFQIFNLPIGTYVVNVSQNGFETTEVKGITVREAVASTVPVSLKVGKASESVEVTANPLLNATDATNGYILDSAQIAATPLATDSFTQLAVLSPGVNAELLSGLDSNAGLGNQNIWANGQRATSNTMQVNGADVSNLFNGMTASGLTSQRYNFNIGGGSTSATSSAGGATVAGANGTSTSVYGSVGNALPSPPSAFIDELRVNTSMYDAQQGATSGAQIDVSTKTGTNSWHGGAYSTFANNDLNANPYFFNQNYVLAQNGVGAFPQSMRNPYLQRWTAGGTIGGPIKRNKAFFFLGYQHLGSTDAATGYSQFTVPSAYNEQNTDCSGGNQASTACLSDALNSWNNKNNNITISPIAQALMSLVPLAKTNAAYQYGVPNVSLTGRSNMTGDQATISVDYQVNEKDRLGAKYYYQNDPITSPYRFSAVAGFPVTQLNGGQVATIDNTIVLSPSLNWEQRLGFVRMSAYSLYNQTVTSTLGDNFGVGTGITGNTGTLISGLPGLLLKDFPFSQNDSPALKLGPYSSFANTGFYQNRLNPSTNLIWVKGPHSIIAGGGYSYTQLNITNNRQGIAQVATKNFETFLEGQVSSSNVLETTDPQSGRNTADRYYRANEIDGYLQDKWQIRSNLSLTIGLRYDYHGGLTEKYGDMFNFDPSLYDVTGTTDTDFTVNNAGFIVAGNNKYHPTPGVSDSTLTGRQWGLSPRLGFAWTPPNSGGKIVVRGAWGIYYDRGENFQYLSQPAGSGNGGPFGVTESAPLASYVTGNGKTLSNPLGTALNTPSDTPPGNYILPSSDPSVITAQLQQTLNGYTGTPGGYNGQFGKNCSGVQNQEDYTACPDALNFGAYARNNVLPYTMNYSLDVQWQPTYDIVFSLGYVGNRGRHAVIPIPFNAPGIATASNPIWGETSSYGFEVLNQNSLSDGYDYDPIPGEPWNTEDGGNTDFRTPYIGFSPNAAEFKTVGNSAYDALQSQFQKRLSHNFQLGAAYTWSHALDEQSDLGLFFTGNDPANLRNSWASADFDRTNVFSTNFVVKIPSKVRDNSALALLTNGWELTGIGIVQSGEPYSLYEFYGAVGSIKFGDYPTLMNPVLGVKNAANPKQAMTGNKGDVRTEGGAYIPTIDPSQISINYLSPGVMGIPTQVGSNPADIYQTDFEPPQRNIFRQSAQKRLDLSVRKNIRIRERYDIRYDFNVFNLTNTPSLDVPMDQAQIRQNSACSSSAIKEGNNCDPSYYYVNYGQIVSSNNPVDQQSALRNLDELPYHTGTGRNTQVQTTIPVNTPGTNCISGGSNVIPGSDGGPSYCPNNAANFGSVYNTIGSNRVITMGLRVIF